MKNLMGMNTNISKARVNRGDKIHLIDKNAYPACSFYVGKGS